MTDLFKLECAVFSAAACVGWVLFVVAGLRVDGHNHRRKCRHVLRGLSEPRCPECGEPI